MDKQKKATTKEPSSGVFYEAAIKFLANCDINPAVNFIAAVSKPPMNRFRNKFFRFCVSKYPECLSLKLIQIYNSKEPRVLNEIRESALRFLYVILIVEETFLNLATVQELSKRLISCLEEQEISETSIKILSELVYRMVFDLVAIHKTTWHDLREFILSRSETEFVKTVSVFKSLAMPLDSDEFVIPLMEKLLPTILIRLSGDKESSSHWYLAFVGGFCAVVHLLKTTRVDLVKNLAYEMVKSVKRGMELGFMNIALKEVEVVVVKQLYWYCKTELRFVLGLVQRIDAVITEQSPKYVLKNIEMVVKKKMLESGVISDEDWLNQCR